MKVRLTSGPLKRGIARIEAFLAGMILTVSTAYAATVCPLYWTQLKLEAELTNRQTIAAAADRWHAEKGVWPQEDLADLSADTDYDVPRTSPLTGCPYRLDPVTHQIRS